MGYTTVLFDLDHTLLDSDESEAEFREDQPDFSPGHHPHADGNAHVGRLVDEHGPAEFSDDGDGQQRQ